MCSLSHVDIRLISSDLRASSVPAAYIACMQYRSEDPNYTPKVMWGFSNAPLSFIQQFIDLAGCLLHIFAVQ